ncbi:segregation and condensation protein A [Peptoniphilaceae bacterium SGI.131]
MINISTEKFNGPFDVLLDLIEKSKINIYDIQISDITNKYIETIRTMDIATEEIADFILIATQLLYLKTKSLVQDTLEDDEPEDIDDENISKEELIRRLVEYKKIKGILSALKELELEGRKQFTKLQEDLSIYRKTKEDDLSFESNILKESLEKLISKNLRKEEFKVDKILNVEEYSTEEYKEDIKLKIIKKRILSISKMLKKVKSKAQAIVIFLSVLELSRRNNLTIEQDENTKEIVVKLKEDLANAGQ